MTTKLEQALKDLEATCEDLADLDEAFKRGRLQGLEEAAGIADKWANSVSCDEHDDDPCCHVRTGARIAALVRERAAAVGAQEENTQ